jgi:zinc and cadmium transporter
MADAFTWALGAVIAVSLVSFVGALSLAIREQALHKLLNYFVSFAAGAMLGVAFLDILPEAVQIATIPSIAFYALLGLVVFYILERFLYWYHCHGGKCESHGALGPLVLLGDGIHNFLDGLIIGTAFIVNIPLGVITTLAVVLHEIPQELGDFGALIYSGFSKGKALFYNFLSALTAVLGAVVAFVASNQATSFTAVLLPISFGGFLFIGTRMLFDLHHESRFGRALLQLVFLLIGISLMGVLTSLFHA